MNVVAEPLPALLLWPEGAPGAHGESAADRPAITPYFPDAETATGAAMLILPGGGYGHLAPHEGDGYARFLAEHGIAAFVLKYRLGSDGYRHPAMLHDAARGMRFVRANASEWSIDKARIGVMGSSAGGHLASTLLTHFDAGRPDDPDPVERESSRPDIGVLCYPVITLGQGTHEGSRLNLLGPDPSPEDIALLSNERQVTADTPPCFVWHTAEDPAVPASNSIMFAAALSEHRVPFELHVYERGAHGIGLGVSASNPDNLHPWTDALLHWLQQRNFIKTD